MHARGRACAGVLSRRDMSNSSSKRQSAVALACLVTLSGLALGVAFEPAKSEAAGRGMVAKTNQLVPAASRVEQDGFVAEVRPVGTYVAGKEGVIDVVLTAKEPFHTNDAYPYKFRVTDPAPEGVTYPKPLLKRDDGKFDQKTGTFRVPFVASKAGKFSIGGTLSLSVCSPSSCLMEKVELALDVDVK